MKKLKFRNAELDDLTKIVEIYNSTIASRMVTADTELVSVESRQEWFNEHSSDSRPLWVIESSSNNIIGWVSFQSFYGRPAYNITAEISIYVDVNKRGKGFGKEILKYCIDYAPKLGIKNLLGFIFSHNEPSLKLFQKLYFEKWATLSNVAVLDGKERGLVIMGKRID